MWAASVCLSYWKYTLWQVCVISEFKFQPPVPLINFNDYDFKLNKDRDHLGTYLFQWQQQWGLLRDSKDSEKFQIWWHECFLSACQWLQRYGLAIPYTERNNTNGSNTNSRHESENASAIHEYSHLSCWACVLAQCAMCVTNDVCACFSLSTHPAL